MFQPIVTNITYPVCVLPEPRAVIGDTSGCDICHKKIHSHRHPTTLFQGFAGFSCGFRGILISQVPARSSFKRPFVPSVRPESRPEFLLEPRIPPQTPLQDPERTKKRLLLALSVLLVALVAVILKNWDFWFPPVAESDYAAASAGQKSAKPSNTKSVPSRQPVTATGVRDRRATGADGQQAASMSATTERAALPDLQVEVIAGNQRKTVTAHSNTIHVDLASPPSSTPAPVAPQEVVANSANHLEVSPQAAQAVSKPVAPDYPLLARQMKVQGAVILQALISREGKIQELQIVSGPDILAAAAREAVKQWHFRPFYQNGRPVESQARVTVNFTISTN